MARELSDSIKENAQGPAKAQGDQGSMEQHPLPDQIAADRYLAEKRAATRRRGMPFRTIKMIPPSAD